MIGPKLGYNPDAVRAGLARVIDDHRAPVHDVADDGLEILRRYAHETHLGARTVNYWDLITGLAHGREAFDHLARIGVMVRDEHAGDPPRDVRYRLDAERLGDVLETQDL